MYVVKGKASSSERDVSFVLGVFIVQTVVGWIGLDWIGLDWIGLDSQGRAGQLMPKVVFLRTVGRIRLFQSMSTYLIRAN